MRLRVPVSVRAKQRAPYRRVGGDGGRVRVRACVRGSSVPNASDVENACGLVRGVVLNGSNNWPRGNHSSQISSFDVVPRHACNDDQTSFSLLPLPFPPRLGGKAFVLASHARVVDRGVPITHRLHNKGSAPVIKGF